jgi:hypothetical protein
MTRLGAALLIACVVIGCGSGETSDPSGPSSAVGAPSSSAAAVSIGPSAAASGRPSTGDPVADARIADLAYLVQQLTIIHPNGFLDEGEAAFMARVADIEAKAGSLDDVGFLVAIMGLMGHRDRDGHTGAWAMAQPGTLLRAWPLWLYDFPDGLRVVAARAPNEDLVGARVTRVGHAPVAEARTVVEPLVPRDNPSNLRSNLPIYLTLPDVLTELGLLDAGDAGLTLEMPDGSVREVTPEAIPVDAMRDWVFGVYGGHYPEYLPPAEDGPLPLRHQDLAFWSTPLTKPAGTYVGYNVVTRTGPDGHTIAELATTTLEAAAAHPGAPIVVDLRNNGGGDNNTFRPFKDALASIAADQPGSVRLIVGRATFSAAGNFVTDLKVGPQKDGIVLVGEPAGGGLNIYGDVKVVTLPASKVVVLIAGRYHERAPGDARLQIEPDVPVELSWADYLAGRDPVLEAARRP